MMHPPHGRGRLPPPLVSSNVAASQENAMRGKRIERMPWVLQVQTKGRAPMAMRATEQQLREAVQTHLEPRESVQHVAYGIKPPMVLVAAMPILYTMLTKHYVF